MTFIENLHDGEDGVKQRTDVPVKIYCTMLLSQETHYGER